MVQVSRPPWKFVLNTILVILLTFQITGANTELAPYIRSSILNWEFLLSPSTSYDGASPDPEVYGFNQVHSIYRAESLIASLNWTATVYFSIKDLSVDFWEYLPSQDPSQKETIRPLIMEVQTYEAGMNIFNLSIPYNDNLFYSHYDIYDANNLGPFANLTGDALRDYIHTIYSMKMQFSLLHYQLTQGERRCYRWDISAVYDFSVRGSVEMALLERFDKCPQGFEKHLYRGDGPISWLYYIFWLNLVVATTLQILLLRSLKRSIEIYSTVRNHNQSRIVNEDDENFFVTWDELSCSDKLQFF